MPTDSASIPPLIERINSISSQFYENGRFSDFSKQQQLVRATEQLLIVVREPDENLHHTATQVTFWDADQDLWRLL